ncbi:MAG: hypothetical protein ACK4VV_07890 [Pseudomonas sp.]
MKNISRLALIGLFSMTALPAMACSLDEINAKAEEVAETINRLADNNPEKARALNEQLLELQREDPTRSDHGACEAYQRIIDKLENSNNG